MKVVRHIGAVLYVIRRRANLALDAGEVGRGGGVGLVRLDVVGLYVGSQGCDEVRSRGQRCIPANEKAVAGVIVTVLDLKADARIIGREPEAILCEDGFRRCQLTGTARFCEPCRSGRASGTHPLLTT